MSNKQTPITNIITNTLKILVQKQSFLLNGIEKKIFSFIGNDNLVYSIDEDNLTSEAKKQIETIKTIIDKVENEDHFNEYIDVVQTDDNTFFIKTDKLVSEATPKEIQKAFNNNLKKIVSSITSGKTHSVKSEDEILGGSVTNAQPTIDANKFKSILDKIDTHEEDKKQEDSLKFSAVKVIKSSKKTNFEISKEELLSIGKLPTFTDKVTAYLKLIENQNIRLENIYNHINKII